MEIDMQCQQVLTDHSYDSNHAANKLVLYTISLAFSLGCCLSRHQTRWFPYSWLLVCIGGQAKLKENRTSKVLTQQLKTPKDSKRGKPIKITTNPRFMCEEHPNSRSQLSTLLSKKQTHRMKRKPTNIIHHIIIFNTIISLASLASSVPRHCY